MIAIVLVRIEDVHAPIPAGRPLARAAAPVWVARGMASLATAALKGGGAGPHVLHGCTKAVGVAVVRPVAAAVANCYGSQHRRFPVALHFGTYRTPFQSTA